VSLKDHNPLCSLGKRLWWLFVVQIAQNIWNLNEIRKIHVSNIKIDQINKTIVRWRLNIIFHLSSKETTEFLKYQA
jgi:hypothetical protein